MRVSKARAERLIELARKSSGTILLLVLIIAGVIAYSQGWFGNLGLSISTTELECQVLAPWYGAIGCEKVGSPDADIPAPITDPNAFNVQDSVQQICVRDWGRCWTPEYALPPSNVKPYPNDIDKITSEKTFQLKIYETGYVFEAASRDPSISSYVNAPGGCYVFYTYKGIVYSKTFNPTVTDRVQFTLGEQVKANQGESFTLFPIICFKQRALTGGEAYAIPTRWLLRGQLIQLKKTFGSVSQGALVPGGEGCYKQKLLSEINNNIQPQISIQTLIDTVMGNNEQAGADAQEKIEYGNLPVQLKTGQWVPYVSEWHLLPDYRNTIIYNGVKAYVNNQKQVYSVERIDTKSGQCYYAPKQAIGTVECFTNYECPSGKVCDQTTYTCTEQPQCQNDVDCSEKGSNLIVTCTNQGCTFKESYCSINKKCEYKNVHLVQCNEFTGCGANEYCDVEGGYVCKQSITPPGGNCPYQCCPEGGRYAKKDCPAGATCVEGVCKSPSCAADEYIDNRGLCVKEPVCKKGQEIDKTTMPHTCREKRTTPNNLPLLIIIGVLILILIIVATRKKRR